MTKKCTTGGFFPGVTGSESERLRVRRPVGNSSATTETWGLRDLYKKYNVLQMYRNTEERCGNVVQASAEWGRGSGVQASAEWGRGSGVQASAEWGRGSGVQASAEWGRGNVVQASAEWGRGSVVIKIMK
jgi:hypothetical protein